MNKFNMY